jgi:hypothetical protein
LAGPGPDCRRAISSSHPSPRPPLRRRARCCSPNLPASRSTARRKSSAWPLEVNVS